MIRLAFLGVVLIAGLLAFGAFYLARGSGADATPTLEIAETTAPETTTPEAEPEPPLYFLQDIDLTDGPILVVLSDALTGQGDMVVRDQAAIAAAKDTAYINTASSGGEIVGMVVMAMMGVAPEQTVARVYRGEELIGVIDCLSSTCGPAAGSIDADLGPLMAAAQPLVAVNTAFDTYDDYLASIETINASPDYMFLDLRPDGAAPTPRQTATMELHLPTLIVPAGTDIDPNVNSALARSLINPLLPDGAQVNGVTFSDTGAGVIADTDSGTPVLAGGAPIPFEDVTFTNLRISVEGAATLDQGALDSLTAQPFAQTDYADAFAAFTRDRLQNDCTDCFTLQMRGDFYGAATITASQPEGYPLSYYDLREAP